MKYTRAELESFQNSTVPDVLGDSIRLLFVGINPGLWTAATQTHFAHPGNRFYPALLQAGIIDREIDRRSGFSDGDKEHLFERGIGITNLVSRATVKASELSTEELRAGRRKLEALVEEQKPAVVAIAGITAYRSAFKQPKATAGRQDETFGEAALWVVPNPSGLNAHETVETLAQAYAGPAREAGLIT